MSAPAPHWKWMVLGAGLIIAVLLTWAVGRGTSPLAKREDVAASGALARAPAAPRPTSAAPTAPALPAELQPIPSALDGGAEPTAVVPPTPAPDATTLRLHAWLAANAQAAARSVDAYCDEVRHLRRPPEPPRQHDAASFLGVRVGWEPTPTTPARRGLLYLPRPLVARMETPRRHWLTFTTDDWAGLDFAWLAELGAYDHWSLSADGPLRDLDALTAMDAPQPFFWVFLDWAKLRLVKGWREGQLPVAAAEVRHLGDLCASTGLLTGELFRVALYELERATWEAAGQAPPAELPTRAEADGLNRAALAGAYFLAPGVPRAVKAQALACTPTRCSALTEALAQHVAWRAAAPDAVGDLDWLTQQPACDPGLAQRQSKGAPVAPAYLADTFPMGEGLQGLYPEDAGR